MRLTQRVIKVPVRVIQPLRASRPVEGAEAGVIVVLSTIMATWGLWNLVPQLSVYAVNPAWAPMTRYVPIWVWGVAMMGVAVCKMTGVVLHRREVSMVACLLASFVWAVLAFTLWTASVKAPGAGIALVYDLATLWVTWRLIKHPTGPAKGSQQGEGGEGATKGPGQQGGQQ